jgi:hypothetical protein
MTHRANIHMRLRTLKLRLAHGSRSPEMDVVDADLLVAAIGIEPMTFRL